MKKTKQTASNDRLCRHILRRIVVASLISFAVSGAATWAANTPRPWVSRGISATGIRSVSYRPVWASRPTVDSFWRMAVALYVQAKENIRRDFGVDIDLPLRPEPRSPCMPARMPSYDNPPWLAFGQH